MITRILGSFFSVLLIALFALTGCDMMKGKEAKQEPAPVNAAPAQAAAPASQPPAANVLAKIDNWTLTVEEFNERLTNLKEAIPDFDPTNAEVKKAILEELINQQLMVAEAEKNGLGNQKEIKAATEEFRRSLMIRQMAQDIAAKVEATEQEAKDFYEQNKDRIIQPVQWKIREIVVADQLKANELSVEVLKGTTDFAEIAKQNSISESAAEGGDLGYLSEAPFPEMAEQLLTLSAGDVSSVFKGPQGFYIVKLEEKKGGEQIPYEEVKDEIIKNRTFNKQQEALMGYLDRLKQNAKITVNEALIGGPAEKK